MRAARFWAGVRRGGWHWQFLLVVAVAGIAWYFAGNTIDNLTRRNIPVGFDFLARPAGFDIPFKLVEWSPTDTYAKAVLVALLNTLMVSVLAIITTTALGLTLGILRLSPNWLARTGSLVVVEVVKNTPQLVQIFFLYVGILQALPQARASLQLGDGVFLNIRGLFLPAPVVSGEAGWAAAVVVLAIVAAVMLWRRGKRLVAGGLVAIVLLALWPAGVVQGWEKPALAGFNFRGGFVIKPELLALWLGLTAYGAAFIADIVRAAILGVSKGQTEAAASLGLKRGQILRLVILPQALRMIIPPLTSQYLNVIKSSSLGAAIAYPEVFLMIGGTTLNQTGQAIEAMVIVMAIFLAINLGASMLMNKYNAVVALRER